MKILNGRYGAYISYKKQNYKIPKGSDPKSLTLEECLTIVKETEPSKPLRSGRKKK
jgi:DNA topoisomerase-1